MFDLLTEIHPVYCPSTSVYNWASRRTGIQLVLVKRETPAVSGFFAVATEIANDSGCPHTLEHLVFMGSKKYPYKGLLDTLGNKQLSDTNAWTSQDQTVYTLSTAGWQGFGTILPVYLDHILHPVLDDNSCITEVYHIDGKGHEKGVVFSEMQAVEDTSSTLVTEEAQKLLFPEGSGYRSNTGGALGALRVLKNRTIQQYHASAYAPSNLAVIITGDVEPADLVAVMNKFDEELPDLSSQFPSRPFVDSELPQPLSKTVISQVEFPEKDVAFGEAQVSWIGPEALDLENNTAVHVISTYFTLAGIGKLQPELVNVEDPLTTDASMYTDDFARTVVNLYMSGIPTEKLDRVDAEVMAVFAKHASLEHFDLEFMRDCVRRDRDKFVLSAENDSTIFACIAIDSFIYGDRDGSTLKDWIKDTSEYDTLLSWSPEKWVSVIDTYFVQNHHATVLARPSVELYRELKEARRTLSKEIKETRDLEKLGNALENAKADAERPVPVEVIQSFPKPEVEKIKLISTLSAGVNQDRDLALDSRLQEKITADTPSDFKLQLNFESYRSEFLAVKVYLSSGLVDKDLLPYVDVILSEAFSMPMELDDGTKLSYQEVGAQLKRDTLVNSITTNGMLQELVMIDVRTKLEDYEKAIMWVERVIFNVIFDPERLKIFVKKHLGHLAEEKRDGSTVLTATKYAQTLTDTSLRRQSEGIVTEQFFQSIKDDPARIIADMQRLTQQLFVPENVRVLVHGDIFALPRPVSSWKGLADRLEARRISATISPVPVSWQAASALGDMPANKALITIVPPAQSTYVSIISKAPRDHFDPDLPALTVLNSYLGVSEGPLWKEVRGAGLAYGARIYQESDMGHMVCEFYRASDPIQAYKATRKMVIDLAEGRAEFEDDLLEGAILALAGALALDQSTHSAAIVRKYFDGVLRGRGAGYVQELIKRTSRVTKDQVRAAIRKYVVPLFQVESSAVFVVCHPSSSQSQSDFWTSEGYEVTQTSVDVNSTASDAEYDSDDNGYDDSGSDLDSESGSENESESESESDSASD